MEIKNITDETFGVYGRVITDFDDECVKELITVMKNDTCLPDEVIYVPSDEKLEKLKIADAMSVSFYGNMPVQVGYCNGHNNRLNALEYHRSSEINIAATDMILLLGRQQDIAKDYIYDTSKAEAFFVPEGSVVEMYATTLHYAPCGAGREGFKCAVVLPRGTNGEIKTVGGMLSEDKLLAAANKWLIAHESAGIEGAFAGLKGENITVE